MKIVYGIGLPRTGTTTLSKALDILGFVGSNYCMLTNTTFPDNYYDNCFMEENIYRVDNSIFKRTSDIRVLVSKVDNGYFILTDRNKRDWLNSIAKFDNSDLAINIEEYKEYIKNMIPAERLLIINWSDGKSWEKLCGFLDVDIPNVSFPCENC